MSILLDRDTKVIVQGITGRMARYHTKDMVNYGTNVVGGVVPGKGGECVEGVPVFDTVKDAVSETGAEASLVFVPPPFAADSIMEAADAGITGTDGWHTAITWVPGPRKRRKPIT